MATEIVFERDHKLGTLWSLLLAWVAESEGERDWSKRFLDETRKRWEGAKLESLWENWQGEMAAFLLSELWQIEGAIEVAGLVLDDEHRRDLAISRASKGLFDQALQVIDEGDAERRAQAFGAIAEGMAKAGMVERAKEVLEQALKVAEGIKDAERRARALAAIAVEMAKAGMFDQSMKVAEGIEDARERAEALREIAGEMAKAGMVERAKEVFDQALKVAKGIENAGWRATALREIAEGMAKAGMF